MQTIVYTNETLLELIKEVHSKAQMKKIVAWIGNRTDRADSLVKLVLENEKEIAQRASWPLSNLGMIHPKLLEKHLENLVAQLELAKIHPAIKRNTLRLLESIDLPEELQGRVMDLCFRIVESPEEPIACKAFALGNLRRLSLQYPEILPEIRTLIEARLPFETPAFKARAKIFFKKINQQDKNSVHL